MKRTTIIEGDHVRITFPMGGYIHLALVTYTPAATGDSWHLLIEGDSDDAGTVIYVQSFETMIRIDEIIPIGEKT